jgi:hypothetical protein
MKHVGYIGWMCAGLAAVVISGCGSSPKTAEIAPDCPFPNSAAPAPSWVCDGRMEGVAVSAVGSAEKSAAGHAHTMAEAKIVGRAALAETVKTQIQAMVKRYAETTGVAGAQTVDKVVTDVTKQITNETLVGSRLFKSTTGPDGTQFVLMGLDEGALQQVAKQAVNTSMGNDQALWQQFKAQKGQEELADAIAKQKVEMTK